MDSHPISIVRIEQTKSLNIEYSLHYLQEITLPHAWSGQPPDQNRNFAISFNDIKFGYTDPGSRPSSNAKSAKSVGGHPSPSCTSKYIHAAVTISRQPRNDAPSPSDRSSIRESKILRDLFHESCSKDLSVSRRQNKYDKDVPRVAYPDTCIHRYSYPA